MVDRISLKQLQLMSFFMTAFFFVLLAILQPYLIQVRRNTMLCFVKSPSLADTRYMVRCPCST